jgi:hypothetical protein
MYKCGRKSLDGIKGHSIIRMIQLTFWIVRIFMYKYHGKSLNAMTEIYYD